MPRIDYTSNFLDTVRHTATPEPKQQPHSDEALLRAAALCLQAVAAPESLEGKIEPEFIADAQERAVDVSNLILRRLNPNS